ncbi:MAG TPA: alpha/beta hydrolase [Aliidongia sp.]|nr:alpha/beta hydrolase [Aliidongia sp.]
MVTNILRSGRRLAAVLAVILAGLPVAAPAVVPYPSDAIGPLVPDALPNGFSSSTAVVGDVSLHYVRGGSGPTAVVLLHDWPETWYAWRKLLPALAEGRTVIAPDLRGAGNSTVPPAGYDAATLAEDIHGLVRGLGLKNVLVVGQGIGGMVAYAYARLHPDEVTGITLLDTALPGLGPWAEIKDGPGGWIMGFNADADLSQALVQGREAIYFRQIFDRSTIVPQAITDADVAVYLRAAQRPGHLKAGFEFYRALPADEAFDRQHTEALPLPILLVGGEQGLGRFEPRIAEDLALHGATDVRTVLLPGCGHWIAEEQPEQLAGLLMPPPVTGAVEPPTL